MIPIDYLVIWLLITSSLCWVSGNNYTRKLFVKKCPWKVPLKLFDWNRVLLQLSSPPSVAPGLLLFRQRHFSPSGIYLGHPSCKYSTRKVTVQSFNKTRNLLFIWQLTLHTLHVVTSNVLYKCIHRSVGVFFTGFVRKQMHMARRWVNLGKQRKSDQTCIVSLKHEALFSLAWM